MSTDAKAERSEFGRFFYRFPSGEAGLDVYNRVSSFIPTLVRDCTQYDIAGHNLDNVNIVIVTHGESLWWYLELVLYFVGNRLEMYSLGYFVLD